MKTKEPPKHGKYYYGEGFSFLSDEFIFRRFTQHIKQGPLQVLLILNREIWLEKNLTIEASASSIALKTHPGQERLPKKDRRGWEQPGERSVERHLQYLRRYRWLRLIKKGHLKVGNTLFVEPIFIWSSKWHRLKGIEFARSPSIIEQYRQNGGTLSEVEVSTAKMAAEYRQNGGTRDESIGTECRQNGADSSSVFSGFDAPSHSPKNGSESGENGGASNEKEQRSPDGHDQVQGNKGVGLTADPFLNEIGRRGMDRSRALAARAKQPLVE